MPPENSEHEGGALIDRQTGRRIQERVLGDRLLRLAYRPIVRPVTAGTVFRFAVFSRLAGWFCDTRLSARRIPRVVRELGIDMSECVVPPGGYPTFNAFFTRHLKPGVRPVPTDDHTLCSPADARVLAYPKLETHELLSVKNADMSLQRIVDPQGQRPLLQAEFASAAVVVFRLCPSDYHRFHFPATGTVSERWEITGRYESVNPLVFTKGIPVYQENWRRVTRAVLDVAGPCLLVEIGAFGVAGIVETHGGDRFARMQEKGYFKFGGSTILLAFQAHRVAIAEDLVANTDHGFETRILAGQPIATLRST